MVRRSLTACVFVVLPLACDPPAGAPCEDSVPALSEVRVPAEFDAWPNDMEVAADGGYILAGYTAGQARPLFDDAAYESYLRSLDSYFVKTDKNGTIEWTTKIAGNTTGQASSIQPTIDGGYVYAGTIGALVTDPKSFEPTDISVGKIDSNGGVVWERLLDGERFAVGRAICVNPDDSFVVVGTTRQDAAYDDVLVIKFDADGGETWRRRLSAGFNLGVQDIIPTDDGGYAIAGYTDTPSDAAYADDVYVAVLDATGNTLWDFRAGDHIAFGAFRYGEGIVQTRDGGFAVVGRTFEDLFVVKLDRSGNFLWAERAPGAPHARGYDIIELADESLVAAGDSFAYNFLGVPACNRMYVVCIGENGGIRWDERVSETAEHAFALVENDSGEVVLAGPSSENLTYAFSLVTINAHR